MAKVGIGMTAFNHDRYIDAAIQSIVAQTYPDWRLVIVEDGSSDETLSIAQSWADRYPQIEVISQPHAGHGPAFARAMLALADCEYLSWVDSDDLLAPTALDETVLAIEQWDDIDLVYTHYRNIDADTRNLGLGYRCAIPYSIAGLLKHFMVFHFRLMRTEAYFAIGGIDASLPAAEAYDFILRFSERFNIRCLPEVLYCYRMHQESFSHVRHTEQVREARAAIARAVCRRQAVIA